MVLPQKVRVNKTISCQTHHMTIEVRGKIPNFNGRMVRLALHLWGLPRIIEKIQTPQYLCNIYTL